MLIDGIEFYSSHDGKFSYNLNLGVTYRMLSALRHGHINRTNLAGKTGINYSRCIKYVKILLMLGWVKTHSNEGYFELTNKGREFLRLLTDE